MDGQRFDAITRSVAATLDGRAPGVSRRRALRLAGGGLVGALLAAAGFGRRAGAQGGPPCGELYARCLEAVGDACREEEDHPNMSPYPCYAEHGGGACRAWIQACPSSCGAPNLGGFQDRCSEGRSCATALNPGNQIVCRCVEL